MKPLFLMLLGLMLGQSAAAQSTRVSVDAQNGQTLRGGQAQGPGVWCSQWVSNAQLSGQSVISITAQDGKNNLTLAQGDGIILAEGATNNYSYNISAPAGYVITDLSASLTTTTPANAPRVQFGTAPSLQVSQTAQSFQLRDINKNTLRINLSSQANNATLRLSNFQISVLPRSQAGLDNQIPYKLSTSEKQYWYYIVSAATKAGYCVGKVLMHDVATNYLSYADRAIMPDRLWSFWEGQDGCVAIKNYNNVYLGTAPSGLGGSTALMGTTTVNATYKIQPLADDYTISDGRGAPLHAQQDGKRIVRWAAEAGNASTWNFEPVEIQDPQAKLTATQVEQGKVTTAMGNTNVGILRSTISVGGLTGTISMNQLSGNINATNLSDVTAVRAYLAHNARELYIDDEQAMPWREQNGTKVGEGTIHPDGTYDIPLSGVNLGPGTHYLWLALDISSKAKEGNQVDATITQYVINNQQVTEKNGNPQYAATIFLSESAVLMPMDKGSLYYRIPAITTTADGKRLVTLTDDRLSHNVDLPAHCYLVAQYSDDGGRTWSNPKHVAGTRETGGDYGHGDAQIITNRYSGEIIGIMTSSPHGTGFFSTTVDKPMGWKTIVSSDGGQTWSVPVEHTVNLYGKGSPNPHIKGGFSGSGAGLQLRDGTLISPFVARDTLNANHYYNILSRDGGKTWQIYGTAGTNNADEPKILERNNGDLAISVRTSGYNYHNVSSDGGQTWMKASQTRFTSGISGNACDGEYMVWCSTLDGNPWNIALQTRPNSPSRQNVSIALSTDEGETFGTPKTICPRGSAYSAATVMGDGTLGLYYEENGLFGGYTMRFVRFSLDWASDGKYKFTPEQPFRPIHSQVSVEIPADGWQTITLPFATELPQGLKAYTVSGETKTISSGNNTYRALLADPVSESRLSPHTPYLLHGAQGSYLIQRPETGWQPTAQPAPEGMKNGVLRGWYTNKRIYQNEAVTYYNDLYNIASQGGWVFRRITEGRFSNISAYHCNLELPQSDELYLRPLSRQSVPNAIQTLTADSASSTAYDLCGRIAGSMHRGVIIRNGKKTIQ